MSLFRSFWDRSLMLIALLVVLGARAGSRRSSAPAALREHDRARFR